MSNIQKVIAEAAPQVIGPYSQATIAGDYVFVSGQLPIDPSTKKLIEGDLEMMTHLVIDHLEAILKAAGLSLANVVKTDVFLKDLADFQAMNLAYAKRFHFPAAPARVTIQAGKLPMDARVEISCIAYR